MESHTQTLLDFLRTGSDAADKPEDPSPRAIWQAPDGDGPSRSVHGKGNSGWPPFLSTPSSAPLNARIDDSISPLPSSEPQRGSSQSKNCTTDKKQKEPWEAPAEPSTLLEQEKFRSSILQAKLDQAETILKHITHLNWKYNGGESETSSQIPSSWNDSQQGAESNAVLTGKDVEKTRRIIDQWKYQKILIAQLRCGNTQLKATTADLKVQVDTLAVELQKVRNNEDLLARDLRILLPDNEAMRAHINQLLNTCNGLQQELDCLKPDLRSLRTERVNLQQQLFWLTQCHYNLTQKAKLRVDTQLQGNSSQPPEEHITTPCEHYVETQAGGNENDVASHVQTWSDPSGQEVKREIDNEDEGICITERVRSKKRRRC